MGQHSQSQRKNLPRSAEAAKRELKGLRLEHVVPQMWFWTNWDGTTFHSDSTLQANRASFSDFAPTNNHIPHKAVSVGFSQELPSSLEEERQLVEAFLQSTQPAFTWNGDQSFWRSASGSVGTALDQLRTQKSDWSLDECVSLTEMCRRRVNAPAEHSWVGRERSIRLDHRDTQWGEPDQMGRGRGISRIKP